MNLYEVAYEEFDPSADCPTEDSLAAKTIRVTKGEDYILSVPAFQYYADAAKTSDGKAVCVTAFVSSFQPKEGGDLPLFMRPQSDS